MNQNVRHVFILNPAAGKGEMQQGLSEQIDRICTEQGVDYEIHFTKVSGEATEYVRTCCAQHPDVSFRFYACGGDGTVCETVNGAYGYENASVGIVPVGTGNDYVRNFDGNQAFLDIAAQLDGEIMNVDLIRYNDKLCANMINIGFDCEVVKQTAKLKRNKLIPKGMAYIAGLIITLIRKPGVKASVSMDGGEPQKRRMLLTAAANGAWCGGGFHSTPLASLQDGVLDVLLIKNVTRVRFLTLVGKYKSGSFIDDKSARKVIDYYKCHTISYTFDKPQSICVDGEVAQATSLTVSAERDALRLVVPRGAVYAIESQKMSVGAC